MATDRPLGRTRFQDISASKLGLPSAELDGEFNSLVDYLNSIGTIQSNVSEWATFAGIPTYISQSSFSVVGNQTTTFTEQRRLKIMLGATPVYTGIDGSAYNAGNNTTTITTSDAVVTNQITQVYYSIIDAPVTALSLPDTIRRAPIRSVTASTTLTKHDRILLVDATNAPVTVTLPALSAVATVRAKEYTVMKIDSSLNAVTVQVTNPNTIMGAASLTIPLQGESLSILGLSTLEWKVLAFHPSAGSGRIYYGAIEPAYKEAGRVWYDSANLLLKYADGNTYNPMTWAGSTVPAGSITKIDSQQYPGPITVTTTQDQWITFVKEEAASKILAIFDWKTDFGAYNQGWGQGFMYLRATPVGQIGADQGYGKKCYFQEGSDHGHSHELSQSMTRVVTSGAGTVYFGYRTAQTGYQGSVAYRELTLTLIEIKK